MIAITAIVFVIVEGLSSTAIAVYQVRQKPSLIVSRYDETLGWEGIPNLDITDVWGSGKYVRTNGRGFRNDGETEVTIPNGKFRIICSGNSFTYGEGVANDRTWCHRIVERDNRFETVNLGQPGYGVDQMFLRYSRDGMHLEHSIHILAFVEGDLNRMAWRSYSGHGKPVLRLSEGELVTDNVPVPRIRPRVSRAVVRANFRSVDFAQRVLNRLLPQKGQELTLIDRVGPVASWVFQTVHQLSHEQDIVSVFVFLPTERDLWGDTAWRIWVEATMDTLDLPFIDLTPALRNMKASQAEALFIPKGMLGDGHYTEAGNDWVAEVLYNHLMEISAIRALLVGTEVPVQEHHSTGAKP
jgi:hypothetical protein